MKLNRRNLLMTAAGILTAAALESTVLADDQPPLTTKMVREALRDKSVRFGKREWTFDRDALIELDIVSLKSEGASSVLAVDIRTGTPAKDLKSDFKVSGPCIQETASLVTGRMRLSFNFTGSDYILESVENVSLVHRFIK